ncbi:MAG TPA: PDZ domain-containing protein [Planctomycetota bacterium]|nr:PDZ domain-containing protein [Planctomycetota bacterium]
MRPCSDAPFYNRPRPGTARACLTLALAIAGAGAAAAAGPDLEWRRRALRQPSPQGYLAVATLAPAREGQGRAVLSCSSESVELHAEGGQWTALREGKQAAQGALDGDGALSLFVKRTPSTLLVGANGRWLYSCAVPGPRDVAEVAVGTSAGLAVKSFRIVAREQVRFEDSFPDPVPPTEVWVPVRGPWARVSLTYADKSANPAELAAIFDRLEDVASRGRTREYAVGIGVHLGEGLLPQIALVASDSPAQRAGLRAGDVIREVDGKRVRNIAEATELLQGEAGKSLTLTIERNTKPQKVELTREVVVWGKSKRQVPVSPFCQDGVALIVTGQDYWTDYQFRAAVRTQGVGAVGLVFAYLGPRDYHVFRWLGADKVLNHRGRWLLERVRDGRPQLLAARDGGFHPNDFFALAIRVEGDEPGKLKATCFVDSEAVLSAADDALVPGRIGLWAEAPGVVSFDDVWVGESPRDHTPRGTLNASQLHDPTMRNWADPGYQWDYSGIQHWHKAPFFGDVAITAPVPKGQRLGLTVSASARGAETGYTFILPEDDGPAILQRLGKTVAKDIRGNRDAKRVTLSREGGRVQALLDGKLCLELTDPKPLDGTLVGAAGAVPAEIEVTSPNVVEDYFNGCPTDWHVLAGQWEVMNRWVCNPTWSFFGGRNDGGLLAIWSKRRLDGDWSVEVDAGVMMMERSGRYENMRDVGVSLCADRRDLASGYAVIVGAYQNERTILYRRGKQVASTSSSRALLPTLRAYSRDELHSQHRGWFHIRLTKEANTVRVYVWDNLALTYEDPEPLPGGHAAIWSVENGLMVGKVRLAADRVGPPKPVLRDYSTFADAALTNDCGDGDARIVARGSEYEIANTASGGPFAVAIRPRVFSALDHPKLAFDIKLTPEAKVDLYFTCQSTLYRVPLTGPRNAGFQGVNLPAPEGLKADGQWHRVTIDLLGELRKRHTADPLLMVWEPVLANYANPGYLLAGFGGNGAGATYWLRNIALAPAPPPSQLSSTR